MNYILLKCCRSPFYLHHKRFNNFLAMISFILLVSHLLILIFIGFRQERIQTFIIGARLKSKDKGSWICIAPIVKSSPLKRSDIMDHSVFMLQLHHTCLYLVKAFTIWGITEFSQLSLFLLHLTYSIFAFTHILEELWAIMFLGKHGHHRPAIDSICF